MTINDHILSVFNDTMERDFASHLAGQGVIAVGVSGGADSLALCFLLAEYAQEKNVHIHALTVDHGLRLEAAEEAAHVAMLLKDVANVSHHILKWDHDQKPDARIQEAARRARYDLMSAYMRKNSIQHLFLGHHMADQAETFLFRLAKGSGLDGLSAMSAMQDMRGITLCRPLLGIDRQVLIDYCVAKDVKYIDDPSNKDENFARIRLRNSMDALSEEGLTPKRLSVTAKRLSKAREALEVISRQAYVDCIIEKEIDRIVFNLKALLRNPYEVALRVFLMSVSDLNTDDGYGVRLERVESLCDDFMYQTSFRKRTLGGVIFERDDKKGHFILSKENAIMTRI